MKILGEAKAQSVRASGSLKVIGPIYVADSLSISGSVRTKEVVSENIVDVHGSLNTEGEVKSRIFKMNIGRSTSEVRGGIQADEIDIVGEKKEIEGIVLFGFVLFGRKRQLGRLYTSDIVAKGKVHLENTICENVTGDIVEIGPRCEVKNKIRYLSTITIDENAKVAYPPEKTR